MTAGKDARSGSLPASGISRRRPFEIDMCSETLLSGAVFEPAAVVGWYAHVIAHPIDRFETIAEDRAFALTKWSAVRWYATWHVDVAECVERGEL